ncbi:MAG: hypothetical protein AB7V77_00985 [Candidatus Woesearchaeota archaeon]
MVELNHEEQKRAIEFFTGSVSEILTISNSAKKDVGIIYLSSDNYHSEIKIDDSGIGVANNKPIYHKSIDDLICEGKKTNVLLGIVPVTESVINHLDVNYKEDFVVEQTIGLDPELPEGVTWYKFKNND